MSNKILSAPGTNVKWQDSGADLTMTLAGLLNGTGRLGAQKDFGAGSIESKFRIRFRFRASTTPTVGNVLRCFLVPALDANYRSGGFGAADAAIDTEAKLANALFLGSVEIDEASTTKDFVGEFSVILPTRFASPAVWNATGVALHATVAHNAVDMLPSADEVQ